MNMKKLCWMIPVVCGTLTLQAEWVAIHFQTVFEQFHELQVEDQKLRQEIAGFQQEQEQKVQALQQRQETFNQLRREAAQPGVTEEQRQNMAERAAEMLEALNREEQALREERNQFQQDMEAKGVRLRRIIVNRVNDKIEELSQAQGWSLVLDSSARSPNGLPVIPYVEETRDVTGLVIQELNAGAAVPQTPEMPEES